MAATTAAAKGMGGKLLKALAPIDRPGEVCTSGDMPLVLPGLDVAGVGTIGFPMGKSQAGKLIRKCVQAPYGKGTETVVDTQVRRVWELDPAKFALTNPRWDELIGMVVGDVQKALGLEKAKLHAHLYKLLVYEKGSFFKPHRDGEKLDGMVATLVVALPSPHVGGELIVTHEGRRQEVAFSGAASGHLLSYAAFYADCEHEVSPVEDGYRLCLVYNLVLASTRGKKAVAAPRTANAVDSIAALLRDWPNEAAPKKLAIALDHRYSQDGLRFDTLKGVDRARANALFEAAERAGCVAHLALVTHWQSGSAEGGDYYDDYYRRRNRYRRWSYDDDDEEEDDDVEDAAGSEGTGYEMGEVYDESLSVSEWSDRHGNKVAFGEMPLDREEVVSAQPLDAWELGREEYEGYTGNAGMTLERWYHRAAVVVWPKAHHFAVLCGAGVDAAIAGLETLVKRSKKAAKAAQAKARQECLQFARAILSDWKQRVNRPHYAMSYFGAASQTADRSRFVHSLIALDSPELVVRFLTQIMPLEGGLRLDKKFPPFAKRHGWSTFAPALVKLYEDATGATLPRDVGLLELLCLKDDKDADRIELCQRLAEEAVDAVQRFDDNARRPDSDDAIYDNYLEDEARFESGRDWDDDEDEHDVWRSGGVDRAALLASLVKSLCAVAAAEPLERLLAHAAMEIVQYRLTKVHLKAIFSLEPWFSRHLDRTEPAIADWLSHCRLELEMRTHSPPQPPADFRRPATWRCKCGDCRELRRFLDDPHTAECRFPMPKDRRQHLHRVIDDNRLDTTHVTERSGRPYTLVCKKTAASYERACKIFSRDTENLKRLRAIEATLPTQGKRRRKVSKRPK